MKLKVAAAVAAASALLTGCTAISGGAGHNHVTAKMPVHQGEMGFPEFVRPQIDGAPTLSDPMLVMGATKPVMTGKHGLAAPAMYDWNNDGKRDLLIGEFETDTSETLDDTASTVRVYLNIGTDSSPMFSDKWEYALDTEGNPIAVPQW